MEKISRQPSIQAVPWSLLSTFSQVYSEHCEQKAEWEALKNMQFAQRSSKCEDAAKESVIAEEMTAIRGKPNTLHRGSRKDTFRPSQGLVGPNPSQAPGCKGFNSVEGLL
jgi:hypothetical protein